MKYEEHKIFNSYTKLVKSVDAKLEELSKTHSSHMVCGKGCSTCCMNFGILPVEFFAISHALLFKIDPIENPFADSCKFLINNECSIYENRPIICRTQGYPNVYFNELTDIWDLSVCELNFTDVADDYFENEDDCMQMDPVNLKLQMLNEAFVKEDPTYSDVKDTLLDINNL